MAHFDDLPPDRHVLGYLGSAWIARGKLGQQGWKNLMFHKRAPHMIKVDLLGTGTACQLGRHLPRLDQIEDAAGFVDLRHARLHTQAGRWMWSPPRDEGWMTSTMTDALQDSALFTTVNRAEPPAMIEELRALLGERGPHGGQQLARLRSAGLA